MKSPLAASLPSSVHLWEALAGVGQRLLCVIVANWNDARKALVCTPAACVAGPHTIA